MTTYGFLGLGAMGAPMARRLADHALAGGDRLLVWNRTPGKDADLRARGAEAASGPAVMAAAADVLIVMLPDLPQLVELTSGPAALLDGITSRTVLVVCSSVAPQGIKEYARAAASATGGLVGVVDAPVSGGPEGAVAGSLAVMVGGAPDDVAAAWPALTAMGRTVRHLGPVGAGSLAKACNQMVVASTMIALSEAATLAELAGLDVERFLDVLAGGYAGGRLLEVKRDNLIRRRYPPGGLARYLVKDLDIVRDEAGAHGATLPQADLSLAEYHAADRAGWGEQDMSVVHRLARRSAGLLPVDGGEGL
jgi:2-hydroxy-3-oxopropionate reductase